MAIACRPKSWTWGSNFSLRVNGQPRQVPIGDIVLIDFAGNGRNISQRRAVARRTPRTAVRRDEKRRTVQRLAAGPHRRPAHCDLLERAPERISAMSRASISGRSATCRDSRRRRTIRRSRRHDAGTTAVGAAGAAARSRPYQERSAAPANARSVVVPSNVQWTNTGFNVSRGQYLRFEPSGEIRLSTNGEDIGRAGGAMSARQCRQGDDSVDSGRRAHRPHRQRTAVLDRRHDERVRHAR